MDASLTACIGAAQAGDLEAFGAVVERFQAMAHAVAYTVIGDAHLAQDAAQEAFIEAFVHLGGLREPAAFPGWFRRVVLKCADRLVRGKAHAQLPLDAAGALASAQPGPAELAETRELQRHIQAGIAALPEPDRQVLLLFYMADYPQQEIAALLEVPLSTVKKRLFTARRRLREQLGDLVRAQRPAPDPQFARLVQFFIAVRLGQLAQVRAYLDTDPALIHAQERWDEATARQFGLPVLVSAFTALHRAVYTNDAALAELLLARGAEADARTNAGQTPLHLAVLMDRPELAELLLRHGAQPNRATTLGVTPLHCAVILGRANLAALLLAHGADAHRPDAHGRTPYDWAQLKARADVIAALAGW